MSKVERYAICCPVCARTLVRLANGSSTEIYCPKCKSHIVGEMKSGILQLKEFEPGYYAGPRSN